MKYTDFRKMSSRERKAYLKAGGTVECTPQQRVAIYFKFGLVTAFIVWGSVTLINRHSGNEELNIARHLTSVCVTEVAMKLKDPSSLTRDRATSSTRLTNAGYVVKFDFTATNSFNAKTTHTAQCLFDADQKFVKAGVK